MAVQRMASKASRGTRAQAEPDTQSSEVVEDPVPKIVPDSPPISCFVSADEQVELTCPLQPLHG